MKRLTVNQISLLLSGVLFVFILTKCTNAPTQAAAEAAPPTAEELIAHGKYLMITGSCHDCHSPKIFNPDGSFIVDSTKPLSGHQAGTPLPLIDTNAVKPGKWYLGSSDLTAWVGPWGVSYAANLTPDSVTGIGAWTEENFIGALRTGKHLGQDGGRPILPPMPWAFIGQMTDHDLKSIYTYLRSIKPISNQVPTPVPPTDFAALNSATATNTASASAQ